MSHLIASPLRAFTLFSLFALLASASMVATAQDDERRNYFDDPFVQVTDGLPGCPTPQGPEITRAEMLAETHYRAERGTSCYQSGRCRLPNAYLYDKEIIPRVQKALLADGGFANTRVWVQGQRRWVWIQGCVQNADQARRMEEIVRAIDDVEAVINELVVQDGR